MAEVLRIEGLREFQAKLKAADGQTQKRLRLVLNSAADLIVTGARPLVPVRTGKAANSLKAQSSQRLARVKAGGAKVPYYGWLDFGGSVGRQNSIHRPFLKDGRYIYPTYDANRPQILNIIEDGLSEIITGAKLA